ncbi:DUF3298 and DUF4163 domain-containing protein [Zunongwangia sp.]|uniref:DUF3298 and DUF4163 domain-containing protein n=1 Tax=Zunongwangia sp. TaxID=1965325 RepID=UPI003AA7AD70
MKKTLILIFSIILLISCKDETKKETKELTFQTKNLEKTFEDCDPEKGSCTSIELSYPIIDANKKIAQPINDSIEQHIIKIITTTEESPKNIDSLLNLFIESYKEYRKDFADLDIPWEASVNSDVTTLQSNILSIQFESYVFSGGAHGYGSTTFLNFNPKTGAVYKNSAIFKPEFKDFVEKDFRKKENIPAEDNINSTGMFFENDEFQLPINIGFENDNVILVYNQYEIAAYAAGQFTYTYPISEIQEYLKIKLQKPQLDKN